MVFVQGGQPRLEIAWGHRLPIQANRIVRTDGDHDIVGRLRSILARRGLGHLRMQAPRRHRRNQHEDDDQNEQHVDHCCPAISPIDSVG